MRSLPVFIVAFAASAAQAQVPVPPSRVPLHVVDEATGDAIPGETIVLGTESYYWAGFHGSGTDCFRAATATVNSRDGKASLALPAATANAMRWNSDTRHVELFAYHPGYCASRNASAGWVGFVKWANKENPEGLWGKVESPKPGQENILRMALSTDEPERRLRHLYLVARSLSWSCHEVGKDHVLPLQTAIMAEANAIAKSEYEKRFAVYVSQAWGDDDPRVFYDVDGRDRDGFTPLMRTAKTMAYKDVQSLLASGARADALTGPDGYSVLDLVLSRARDDVRETGTVGQEIHMLRMLDLLAAANPRPTLRGDYREELSDPAQWKLTPHLKDFWMQVSEKVSKLPARPVVHSKCAIAEPAKRSLGLRVDPNAPR